MSASPNGGAPLPPPTRRGGDDDRSASPVTLVPVTLVPATPPASGAAVAPRPVRQAPPPESPVRRPTGGAKAVRILVVDDEPTICKALAIALIREGYEVISANGGEAAHAILAAEPVDVMIADLRMPDLRGDVVYHLASALQPSLRTRTVFTTGDISVRAEEIVRACGCPLLRKPFSLADAIAAVRAVAPNEGASRTA